MVVIIIKYHLTNKDFNAKKTFFMIVKNGQSFSKTRKWKFENESDIEIHNWDIESF